jgi:hypothetical protein
MQVTIGSSVCEASTTMQSCKRFAPDFVIYRGFRMQAAWFKIPAA